MNIIKNNSLFKLLSLIGLLLIIAFSSQSSAATYTCIADESWVTSPNAPSEVPGGVNADFCNFYQFSWQWFLQLMSASQTDSSLRQFEDTTNYPILEKAASSSDPTPNSCDTQSEGKLLFTSTDKRVNAVVIPDRTGQAGTNGKGIYDKIGNVVFYDVRFSRNLCDVGAIQANPEFPSGTTEIKTAWKQLTAADDQTKYLVMEADIDGVTGTETLGLIGFHQAIGTTIHTEFIWASFEHVDNNPNCSSPEAGNWSFTSDSCVTDPSSCTWNNVVTVDGVSGQPPNEICTVHPYGTDSSDPNYSVNISAITDLNTQLKGFLASQPSTSLMNVVQNYFNIGAIWVTDPSEGTATTGDVPNIDNQRGSLRMAKTVLK